MEISKIPSIQNQTAPGERQFNTGKEKVPQNQKAEQKEQPSDQKEQQIQEAVRQLNKVAEQSQVYIQYALNDKSGDYYVKMIDSNTNEVIREIPSKKILDYFADMKKFQGLLYDKKI